MCSLRMQQVVTGGPDGDAAYHVVIDDGTVRVVSGEAGDATVTFMQNWETATAIGRGELSAQGAFMTGLIRPRRPSEVGREYDDLFGGVDDVVR